jgi:tetratricopeptide (TPR) repeat protein
MITEHIFKINRITLFVVLLFCASFANAKVTQTISAKEFEQLEKAQGLIEEKKHTAAKKILDTMARKEGLNNYTRAQIANFTGFYYFDLGQYKQALTQYLKVVKDPTGIPEGFFNQTYYTIAQIYFQLENYKSALNYAKKWFNATEKPPADAYMLIGQAHYMLGDYKSALPQVRKGISMYEAEGRKPKENWLVLLRGIYYERNDYKKMLPVVLKLLKLYPKSEYMLALASTYSSLGQNNKMAAVLEAMYERGLLNEKPKQLVNLASLFMLQGAPNKAALILKKEMDNGRIKNNSSNNLLLAQAYMLSKDYKLSLAPMKTAASSSGNPNHYVELAQSYSLLTDWKNAETYYRKALSTKGANKKLKNRSQVQLALGMMLIEQKKYKEGKKLFQSMLVGNDKNNSAEKWLSYIKAEEFRIAQLNAPINIPGAGIVQ